MNAPDCHLVYANQAFLDLTGYDAEDCIGRNCRFLQGPETDPTSITMIREALIARLPIEICLCNYRKDGTRFHNLLTMTEIGAATGSGLILGCQYEIKPETFRVEERVKDVHGILKSLPMPIDHPWTHSIDSYRMRAESVQLRAESLQFLVEAYANKQRLAGLLEAATPARSGS